MIKSVVITGANSMIGIHIVQTLLAKGVRVLAITRTVSKELKKIPKNDSFEIVQCDISEYSALDKRINQKYDAFIHLAWMGTSGDKRSDVSLQKLNKKYSLDCVELANKLQCKVFLGVGSQAEFGKVDGVIKYNTLSCPTTPYGMAKYLACLRTREKAHELNMKHIWVRIFSVYGPCNVKNSVVMKSIEYFLKGKSLEYTSLTQTWNFLYAKDAAEGILLALKKGTDGNVYCIANSENKLLKEYIYEIRDIIDSNIPLKIGEKSDDNVISLNVDISREVKELGFIPKVSFNQGIKETIKWYKENMM